MSRQELGDILRSRTLRLVVETGRGRTVGTGWVVASELVATCAHVLTAADTVTGVIGGRSLTLEVVPEWTWPYDPQAGKLDLAVLRCPGLDVPAVPCLDGMDIGDELWSHAYPDDAGHPGGEAVSLVCEGSSGLPGGLHLMKASRGQVKPGYSGAPVLNWRTGGVCGLIRTTRDRSADLGARLIPVGALLSRLAESPTPGDPRWLAAMDDTQLRVSGWGPGPVLRSYLDAIIQLADQHSYMVEPDDPPPLADIYVRQQVVAADREGSSDADAVQNRRADRRPDRSSSRDDRSTTADDPAAAASRLLRPQAVPADQMLQHRSVLVTGGAGSGKSTLLRYLARVTATQWDTSSAAPRYAPVLASARRVAATHGSLAEALRTVVADDLDVDIPVDFFRRPPTAGTSWLLMVDGFDEILDGERRRSLRDRLSREMAANPHLRLVFASRPLPDAEFNPRGGETPRHELRGSEMPRYEIQPFDAEQLKDFATRWFQHAEVAQPDVEAERFIRQLERSRLHDLCRTPLMAAMACTMHARSPRRDLPTGRAALYHEAVTLLLEGQERRLRTAVELRARLDSCPDGDTTARWLFERRSTLVEHLAARRYAGVTEELLDLAVAWTEQARPATGITAAEWRHLVRSLLIRTGLLIQDGSDLRFAHQTFLEYLAARQRSRELRPDEPDAGAMLDPRAVRTGRLEFVLFVAGEWALQGHDLSPAARLLLNEGRQHVLLVAVMLFEGIPLAPDCIDRMVAGLRCMMDGPDARDAREGLEALARHLPLETVAEIAHTRRDPIALRRAMLEALADAGRAEQALTAAIAITADLYLSLEDRTVIAAEIARQGWPAQARDILRNLASERPATATDRVRIAEALRGAGEPSEAAAMLHAVIADGDVAASRQAAKVLAADDPQTAAACFVRLGRAGDTPAWARLLCARDLADLDRLEDAVITLRSLLSPAGTDAYERLQGAAQLMALGEQRLATDTLTSMAQDVTEEGWVRIDAVRTLVEYGTRLDAAQVLRDIAGNVGHSPSDRIEAVKALAEIGHRDEAIEILRRLADSAPVRAGEDAEDIGDAFLAIHADDSAIAMYRAGATDKASEAWLRVNCAEKLDPLGEHDLAVATLRAVVHDGSADVDYRSYAAQALYAYAREPSVLAAVRLSVTDPDLPFDDRLRACGTLAHLTAEAWPVELILTWALAVGKPPFERLRAAEELRRLGEFVDADIAVRALLAEPDLEPDVRLQAARALSVAQFDTAIDTLTSMLVNDDVGEQAVASLEDMGTGEAAAILAATAQDRTAPMQVRKAAAAAARRLSPRILSSAPLGAADDEDGDHADPVHAARRLLLQGAHEAAVDHLRTSAADPTSTMVVEVAVELARLQGVDDAAELLVQVTTSSSCALSVRLDAAKALVRFGRRDGLLSWLGALVRDDTEPTALRATAAAGVIALGGDAAEPLRQLLDSIEPAELSQVSDEIAGLVGADALLGCYRRALLNRTDIGNAIRWLCRAGCAADVMAVVAGWLTDARALTAGARALAETGHIAAAVRLLRSFDAGTVTDRCEVLAALGELGSRAPEAIARLRALRGHADASAEDRTRIDAVIVGFTR